MAQPNNGPERITHPNTSAPSGPVEVRPTTEAEGNAILARRALENVGQTLQEQGFARIANKENMAMFEGPHGYKVGIEGPYGDRNDRWRVAVFNASGERIAYPDPNVGLLLQDIPTWLQGYLAARQTESLQDTRAENVPSEEMPGGRPTPGVEALAKEAKERLDTFAAQ